MKESDLFPPVKAWMESHGYTVYSEVVPNLMSTRADAVGITPNLTTVVELKQTLSLDLIEQAIDWVPHANYIFVAIPKRKTEIKRLVRKLLKDHGIGLIEVDFRFTEPVVVERATIKPRLNRRITDCIKSSLTEYHLEHSPDGGHAGGGYITKYRITMIRVRELLEAVRSPANRRNYWALPRWLEDQEGAQLSLSDVVVDGWLDIKTILQYCETHYSAPKPSLSKALIAYEKDWCETKKENGKLWYRYKEPQI